MSAIPSHFQIAGWFKVPHYLFSPFIIVTKSELVLLVVLFHLHNRFAKRSPSQEFTRTDRQLAQESRLSLRTIPAVRRSLGAKGYITYELGRSHVATRYRLLLPIDENDPLWRNQEANAAYTEIQERIRSNTDDLSKNED